MERCLDCNFMLTKTEKVCVECGTKVGGVDGGAADYVHFLVKALFFGGIAATVTAPFLSKGPSFILCVITTCALAFVMRTAKDSCTKIKKR